MLSAMLAKVALDRVNVVLRGRVVLHDITWSLRPGEHWAIVGPNGSGKSLLLRVIAGRQWIEDDGGTRTYSGDGRRMDAVALARTWIRLVSAEEHERYARLDLAITGREIIAGGFDDSVYAGQTQDLGRVEELISRFNLGAFADGPLRERSSGQIRRLLLARALVSQPRLLILDEFTNGLDAGARRDVLEFLAQIAAEVSLVIASHRPADFPAAITHTATLSGGRFTTAGVGRPRLPPALGPAVAMRTPANSEPLLIRIRAADVYRGSTLVLRGLSWDLRRGNHTVIRGRNGAGKTTFAGLIAGTISAAAGSQICRFGETGPFDIWKLKMRIAHVSDDLQIAYDRGETVEDVIASGFPGSIGLLNPPTARHDRRVEELIEQIGLESLRGRSFTRLSFGERRKVLIARSLVHRPAIFVMDEVWNGLDGAFRAALHALLERHIQDGMTIVSIAHDDDDDALGFARRAFRLLDGQLIAESLHA